MSLSKLNIAALTGGPAMIYAGPTAMYSKNGVNLDPEGKWESLLLDGFDEVDKRKTAQPLKIKFTPSGVYNAANIAALCSLAFLPLGAFITPRFPGITATYGAGTITVTKHGRQSGESGYIAVTGAGVLPTGLNAATLYYLGVVDANTLKLYTTQANALSATDPVAFTSNGTAPLSLVINNPLIIFSINDGKYITFWNYGVAAMPDVILTADGKTIFGEVGIEAFLRHGFAPQDANSFYTVGQGAFDPTTFPSLATILTQPYEANWGGEILNVTAATLASPTVITTEDPHGLKTGDSVNLVVTDSTPAINATYVVTVISPTTFSVVVDVTAAGTTGTSQKVIAPPWDNIQTKDGYKIKFAAKVEDVPVDGLGIVTKQLTGATAEAEFLPTNADVVDLMNALNVQGASGILGSSLQASARNFNIIGTGFYLRLYSANFTKGPAVWNMKDRRAGSVSLMATRQFPGGVAQPLMYLGTQAPA